MREKQKARTRTAIVRAAEALLRSGDSPDLEAIAEEAGVSRATAYRYFPGLDALLTEASAGIMLPAIDFAANTSTDPFERLERLDEEFDKAFRSNEAALRLALARAIGGGLARQDRREALIEQALAPLAARLGTPRMERLAHALMMVIGSEGFIALNDVASLDKHRAHEVRRWAIDALVAAALSEAYSAC
jgi:AcrR family transcriptional regulator